MAPKKSQFPKNNPNRLAGKRAVVTGGSRGIGWAIARALVREGCGVMITGRDEKTLNDAQKTLVAGAAPNADVLTAVCDVREEKAVADLFARVKRQWRRLDILVNNAGISQAMHPL
ncbi:MAG TPA: SDR family NAD(P)-dependent oxidoreductase, partial [Terriglobales bacterium]|nr:SDR family NAD(P)-dependent oxidoreductase [Terriglobales bacterium]